MLNIEQQVEDLILFFILYSFIHFFIHFLNLFIFFIKRFLSSRVQFFFVPDFFCLSQNTFIEISLGLNT